MIALLLPLIDKIFGSIITALANAWVSYQTSKEAGFAVAAGADASVAIASAQAEIQNNALKVQIYGTPIYRFVTFIVGVPVSIHFVSIYTDTILAAHIFYGHAVLGVPKPPPPYDVFEWAIVSSFFLVHAIKPATSNVSVWLNKK